MNKKEEYESYIQSRLKTEGYESSTLTDTLLLKFIKRFNESIKISRSKLTLKINNNAWNLSTIKYYKHGILMLGDEPVVEFPLIPNNYSEEDIHNGIIETIFKTKIFQLHKYKRDWSKKIIAKIFDL